MKKIKYILLSGLAALVLASCSDLDLEPKGQMDSSVLLGSEAGIKSYFVLAYQMLPIEDFNYKINDPGYGFNGGNKWDIPKDYQSTVNGELVGGRGNVDEAGGFNYWPYDRIRYVNTVIETLPTVQANFEEGVYNALMGEARFLRAFYYFGLAKRYGGVPIVTTVQNPTAPREELMVPRATELETWQFIHDDLEFAMANMTDKSDIGRGNKYVAAALMSRAMLYAGTIAKYGDYTTASSDPAAAAGLVGIPIDKANYFFEESLKGSKMVKEGPYELVGENLPRDQKEQNYVDLFLTINKEDIFVKQYSQSANQNAQLYHSYDGAASPQYQNGNIDGMAQWPGSLWYPSVETLELYQKLPLENPDGTPRRFNTREELWQTTDFEPRMRANFFFSGQELRGNKFAVQRGVYNTYTGTMLDAGQGDINAPSGINALTNRAVGGGKRWTFDPNNSYQTAWDWSKSPDKLISDFHGCWGGNENNSLTGAFMRKYVDYKLSIAMAAANTCYHPWKVFRFAEILLNEAEAAYELGQKDLAYQNIVRIRNRAGGVAWTPKASPVATYIINGQTVDENLEYIREERARELLIENHRWFDIRRWRVADQLRRLDGGDAVDPITGAKGFTFALQQFRPHAFYPYFVLSEGKYIFIREYTTDWKQFTFEKKAYYESIPGGEININPNLIQNPLW